MAHRILVALILIVWLAGGSVAVYWLQGRQIAKLEYQRPYRDQLYTPPPEYAKTMTLGYEQFASTLLWLRVIQAFGAKLQHIRDNPADLRAFERAFQVIAALDPRFIEAYKFGSFVLGDEGGDQEAALRLLDLGIAQNENRTYQLPYDAVFICLTNLKDYDRATSYVRLALLDPKCPEYVKRLENYIALKKGNYEIALERWVRDDLNAHLTYQKETAKITGLQIESVVDDWNFSIINEALNRYYERHGDYPPRLEALQAENLIGKVRQVNGPLFTRMLEGAEAQRMPADTAVDLIMGTKDRPGCILESDRLPVDLRGEPYLLVDDVAIPKKDRPRVVDRNVVWRRNTEPNLLALRRQIETYYKTYGAYPAGLADLGKLSGPNQVKATPEDPAGMPWKYDPKTGKVSSYVFPER